MIHDLALILVVAGIVTLIFQKLKQPLVLGYIVAGFLVSPQMPYVMSIAEKANIQEWADIGVMFLLFSLGLDFSFKKIVKMGYAPAIAAITIVVCMIMLGFTVGRFFEWGNIDCIFLGGMLAMSSTTIIYKAFDDLGLRQQRFASLVMSVLILEDILAIVLMVMLSAVATSGMPDSSEMLYSIFKIAFFLILWFVVGIFAIPALLRNTRRLMNSETLLVVSLGLCCLMAVISMKAGFSSAFGAFVMGSILAETIEAEKIEKTIAPVKDLFGAIFFVSVGMLVDPDVLVKYIGPIFILVLAIVLGQVLFGTLGYFLSGQNLRTSIRCSFSMAQIGEFAFIIASLGMSLNVIAPFLYPVVVAVSVITTFLTPYMIKGAEPFCKSIERILPSAMIIQLNSLTSRAKASDKSALTTDDISSVNMSSLWHKLLKAMLANTVIYMILAIAVTSLMLSFFLIFSRGIMPHWWANGVTGILCVIFISPFLRAIVVKKNNSAEWKALWNMSPMNRLPLLSTIVARGFLCLMLLFYICNYLARFHNAIVICLGVIVIVFIVLSRSIKHRSIRMERLFVKNLHSRDIAAQVKGIKSPSFANTLLERDLHITDIVVPENSLWAGKVLKELNLSANFGIHVSSILRGNRRINIPGGKEQLFSGDKVQIIGSDKQISKFTSVLKGAVYIDDENIEDKEMVLRQILINSKSPFIGKRLKDSRMREDYGLMLVGIEDGRDNLTSIDPEHIFEYGDILWVVGERKSFIAL